LDKKLRNPNQENRSDQFVGKYIVKRILLAIFTVFVISVITFFAMNAIPGGPFNKEKAANAATIAVLEARYNLDKSLPEQYVLYMRNLLKGDLGVSLKTTREISAIIGESFPISAKLGLLAAAVAIVMGIVLGSVAALMRNRWPDRVIVFFITLVTAMPSFVVATLLLYFFCMKLGLVSAFSAGENMVVLPVIALSMSPMAYITRLTKTSMLDVLGQDYIRTARAKGVSQMKVIFVHGLRNALIPVITYVGPMIAGIITGSMVVESIFNIGGLGSKFVSAITNRDYTLIMATTIFLACLMVLANLITDIVYKIVDPRIKLD
jgi:oligopeptide transport system permease protein